VGGRLEIAACSVLIIDLHTVLACCTVLRSEFRIRSMQSGASKTLSAELFKRARHAQPLAEGGTNDH